MICLNAPTSYNFTFLLKTQTFFLIILNILHLETNLNVKLLKVSRNVSKKKPVWLYANKLSLDIEKKTALWYFILRKEELLINWILVSSICLWNLKITLKILDSILIAVLIGNHTYTNWVTKFQEVSKIRFYANRNIIITSIILFNYLPLPRVWFLNLGKYL